MQDDEVDDRWLALAALLLSGIDEPMVEPRGEPVLPTEEYGASVADLADAHRARVDERTMARRRHPCMAPRRSA